MLISYKTVTLALVSGLVIFSSLQVAGQQKNYSNKILSLGLSGTESCSGKTTFIVTDPVTKLSYELNAIPNDLGAIYGKFIAYNKINNKIYMTDIGDGVNTEISVWGLQDKTMRQQNKFVVTNKIISQFDFDNKGILYSIEDFSASNKEAWIISYRLHDNTVIVLNEKKIVFDDKHELKSLKDGDVTISADGKMYAMFSGKNSVLYEIKNFNQPHLVSEAIYINQFPEFCYSLYSTEGSIVARGNTLQLKNYSYTHRIPENSFERCTDLNNGHLLFESVAVIERKNNKDEATDELTVIQNNHEVLLKWKNGMTVQLPYEIIDAQGKVVFKTNKNATNAFSSKSLANGVYFAKVEGAKGSICSTAFCISR